MEKRKEIKNKEMCDNCDGNSYPMGDYCQGCNMTEYRRNKKKIKNRKGIKCSDLIKKFIDDDETTFFHLDYNNITRASPNKPAKAAIKFPNYICGVDTRDIRKWEIICVAIPEKKVKKLLKEL